jgi:hypothetical protein
MAMRLVASVGSFPKCSSSEALSGSSIKSFTSAEESA